MQTYEKALVSFNSQMIDIKFEVNKDYISQFVLNPERVNFVMHKKKK